MDVTPRGIEPAVREKMRYLPYIRLLTYAIIIGIACIVFKRVAVIPVALSAPAVKTTRAEMQKSGVL